MLKRGEIRKRLRHLGVGFSFTVPKGHERRLDACLGNHSSWDTKRRHSLRTEASGAITVERTGNVVVLK